MFVCVCVWFIHQTAPTWDSEWQVHELLSLCTQLMNIHTVILTALFTSACTLLHSHPHTHSVYSVHAHAHTSERWHLTHSNWHSGIHTQIQIKKKDTDRQIFISAAVCTVVSVWAYNRERNAAHWGDLNLMHNSYITINFKVIAHTEVLLLCVCHSVHLCRSVFVKCCLLNVRGYVRFSHPLRFCACMCWLCVSMQGEQQEKQWLPPNTE